MHTRTLTVCTALIITTCTCIQLLNLRCVLQQLTEPISGRVKRFYVPLGIKNIQKVVLNSTYLGEIGNHFLYKRFHGCHIDSFELFQVDGSIKVDVFANFSQDGQQCDIGFTSSSWCA